MRSVIKNITPLLAQTMLDSNTRNRKMNTNRVKQYTADMRAGRWCANGESIVVTESGILVDGQHRLQAVVNAGITLQFVVATIKDEEAHHFDTGRARSINDSVMMYDNDDVKHLNKKVISGVKYLLTLNRKKDNLTESAIIEFILKNIEIISGFEKAIKIGGGTSSQAPVVAALLSAYKNGYDVNKMNRFMNVLRCGQSENKTEFVIVSLRNHLIANTNSSGSVGREEKYLKTLYALHSFEKGNISRQVKSATQIYYPWIE